MKEIVIDFLNDNYKLTAVSLKTFKLREIHTQTDVGMNGLIKVLIKVFSISHDEITDIFNSWLDQKVIELENKIIDINLKIKMLTGVYINLNDEQLTKIIDDIDNGIELNYDYTIIY